MCACVCSESIVCLLKFSNCLFIMRVETDIKTDRHAYSVVIVTAALSLDLATTSDCNEYYECLGVWMCVSADWITMPTHVEHNSRVTKVSVVTLSRESTQKSIPQSAVIISLSWACLQLSCHVDLSILRSALLTQLQLCTPAADHLAIVRFYYLTIDNTNCCSYHVKFTQLTSCSAHLLQIS